MKWNRERLIYLHPTFWFLLVLSIMTGMFYHLSIVFAIVTWHELGHFFMAKYFNWQVRKITLWMFGGVMETDEHLNKPLLQQFFVTITGPIQHILIFLLLLLVQKFEFLPPDLIEFAHRYNLFILAFNSLPIWPLDGGKLLNIMLNCLTPFKKAYQQTLVLSMTCLLIFFGLLMYWENAILNLLILFAFLLWENRLEWKQRLYVYQRFLLSRMDKQKMKKKLMPLTFSSQTALKDVFTKFFYNRLHPILIKDQPMILTETELLHFYFKKGHYQANLNQIIKQKMKRG